MSWTFVLRSTELQDFRRCRRAWDYGATVRQRLVPHRTSSAQHFDGAIRAALAAYYLPAMDDWSRAIVRPLAMKAFDRWMSATRIARELIATLTADEYGMHETDVTVGHALLNNYFAWAAGIDDFDSIFADHEVWAPIPDPVQPDRDIGTVDGRPVRYLCRVDQLIGDADDEFWLVDHRLSTSGWADADSLMADDLVLSHCWALQAVYPQLVLAGTVTNELRLEGQLEAPPPREVVERDVRHMAGPRHANFARSPISPDDRILADLMPEAVGIDRIVEQQDNGLFRRTVIRRSQASIRRAGAAVAADAQAMQRPDLVVGPTFSDATCPGCAFRRPCDAMESGGDVAAVLAEGYVVRSDGAEEDDRRSRFRPGGPESETTNFRWG